MIVLFSLSILVLIKADFGDRITKNDDKTDQVKEESKEKEVKVKIIEKPNTTKKPTDKLLKNDEEVVKKQEPVDLISSQQNVKVNHVNPHQGNHPNNNQIHPSNNQIHSNGFERRRIYEFTYSKTQNDHPKPDDKEINHKVGLQSSPQESQQQHQKAPPHQQQAPPHQQQASLHQQQPNSEDPFLTFAKLVHSSFFPHASPSNHRLPEVRVPPVPQPPPQPKQPNISPPDFQFNEPFFHSQPAHHRQVHHKPEPLHRQPNHQQVITHKSNVQPIHQNHPPNQQNVIPHSNQQYPFKIPPGFPRPEHVSKLIKILNYFNLHLIHFRIQEHKSNVNTWAAITLKANHMVKRYHMFIVTRKIPTILWRSVKFR